MSNENDKILRGMSAQNLGYMTGIDPDVAIAWLEKHYPNVDDFRANKEVINREWFLVSCAIITDRSIEAYLKMSGELVDVVKLGDI
ncbi:MAG TPA: hypothetical protein VMV36_05975 [Ignavibacteriaceae bacterium]|nr:hypothetical protein [Ignavibacteriaceae bacterium]